MKNSLREMICVGGALPGVTGNGANHIKGVWNNMENRNLNELMREYQKAAHGEAKISAMKAAVRQADLEKDIRNQLQIRLDLVEESIFYGDTMDALVTFPQLLAMEEESSDFVDTYDVLESGVPNAIRTANEVLIHMGKRLKGIRLDSGDLAYLSKSARRMLDKAGLADCKIIASNSLDEFTIRSILEQGGCIDSFGVGERLITAKSDPVFGAVYKLVAVHKDKVCCPKIKVSETFEKITNPGRKRIWRVYNKNGYAVADLITMADEVPDFSGEYSYIDPQKPWKSAAFSDCTVREMQETVMKNGKRVKPSPSLENIRNYVKQQLETEVWPEEQRFENPHIHYLDMSPEYYKMKMELLRSTQKKQSEL